MDTWESYFGTGRGSGRGFGVIREIGRWLLAPFRLIALILALMRL